MTFEFETTQRKINDVFQSILANDYVFNQGYYDNLDENLKEYHKLKNLHEGLCKKK